MCDTVLEVVEEESQNQTITKSLKDGAEEQSRAMVEDEITGTVASASGDTTDGEIGADTDGATKGLATEIAAIKHVSSGVAGRLRILIGFLQIMAGMVSGFSIPWPPMFLSAINFVTVINFDFVSVLAYLDPCSLYSPFLTSAAFHMALLPLFALIVIAAAIVARCCLRNKVTVVSKRAKGIMLELMMFLYRECLLKIVFFGCFFIHLLFSFIHLFSFIPLLPFLSLFPLLLPLAGIVTKCFTTFKCRTIAGVSYMVADYGVTCDPTAGGEWATITSAIMVPAMIVYVLGIPLGIAGFLFANKKWLFGGDTPRAAAFQDIYGGLYSAYEPSYWYFESVVLIQKALLTGGLVLVAPGSSAQILVGLVVALIFYTMVLDGKPYEEDVEDRMQTIATASTVMILLIGFTLKLSSDTAIAQEQADGVRGDYDTAILDVILIVLFSFVTVSGFGMTVVSCPCFASMYASKEEEG